MANKIFSGYVGRLNAEKRRDLLKNRPGIMLFTADLRGAIEDLGLDNETLGQLFRILYDYATTGSAPDLPPGVLRFAFGSIRAGIDRAGDAYCETCIGAAWSRFCGTHKAEAEKISPEQWFETIYNPTPVNDCDERQRSLTLVNELDKLKQKHEQKIEQKQKLELEQGARGENQRSPRENPDTLQRVGRSDLLESIARCRAACGARGEL